jgi:hypothetical protein
VQLIVEPLPIIYHWKVSSISGDDVAKNVAHASPTRLTVSFFNEALLTSLETFEDGPDFFVRVRGKNTTYALRLGNRIRLRAMFVVAFAKVRTEADGVEQRLYV